MRLKEVLFWLRLRKEIPAMRDALKLGQWINVLTVIGQVLASAAGVFPGLALNPYFLLANAVIGAVLPSLGGVSHKLAGTEVVQKG